VGAAACAIVSGQRALPAKAPRPQSLESGIAVLIWTSAHLLQRIHQQWSPRAFPEKIAVGLRLPAESSGFVDRAPGSAAQCQQNMVGQYWVETISPFLPEHAGSTPRPWLRQATTRLKPEKRFPSRSPARRRLSS